MSTPDPRSVGLKSTVPLEYGTPGSAGLDVKAMFASPEEEAKIEIPPGSIMKIATGVHLECLSNDIWVKLETRSSMASKGVVVLGGIIDTDYRGEIFVILENKSKAPYVIKNGDRIAQLIPQIRIHVQVQVVDVSELSATTRGTGGFGSTGV